MRKPLIAALATLCASLPAPSASHAQSLIYLRALPEVAVLSVEHTKTVTSGTGSSSSMSSTTSPEVALNLYLGILTRVSESWLIGAEIRGTNSFRPDIEGDTPSGGSGTHAVWPGQWDFANRWAVGGNVVLGRELGFRNSRGYVFAGASRWNSDFRSAGFDPASDDAVDHALQTGRWPLTAGIGLTLPRTRAIDIRLRYHRSTTQWRVGHEAFEFDYSFVISGLALSVGLGTR